MVCNNFRFLSADGKTSLHAVEWLPEGEVRAVLQIAHGVAEYIERYAPLASFLTERGFAVVGHDHLGHGQSIVAGAPRLYFGPKGSWDWVIADLHALRKRTGERFPDAPYFLMGHSMGSFLARCYLIRHPGSVDGAIIMGTGHMSPLMVTGGRAFAAFEILRKGETLPSAAVSKLSFGTYNKVFAPNRTAFDWISTSEARVYAYVADPLCGENPSMGLFREMLGGIAFMTRQENIEKMDRSTPVFFVSGAMDPVGGLGKEVQRAFSAFQKAGVQDVSMKLYPGLRHEILNEDCAETVHQDLYQWLSERLNR